MISNQVYTVKEDSVIPRINLPIKKMQEIHVVMNVVYMGGHMVQTNLQAAILDWIIQNPSLLNKITK